MLQGAYKELSPTTLPRLAPADTLQNVNNESIVARSLSQRLTKSVNVLTGIEIERSHF